MSSLPAPDRLLADSAWLRNLAQKLVGRDLAADLEQDVVIAALARPQPARERSWLATVARNLAATLRRRQSAERRRLAVLPPREPVPSAAELAEAAELQQKAVEAVLALPHCYRDTVLLRFLQGLSLRDTAAAMGIPEETVRTRQRRALTMLRERLAPARDRKRRMGLLAGLTAWSTTAVKAKHLVAMTGAALLVLFAGTVAWQSLAGPAPEPNPAPPEVAQVPMAGNTAAVLTDPSEGVERIEASGITATPVAEADLTAHVVVRVFHPDSRRPAVGVPLLFRSSSEPGEFTPTNAAGEAEFAELEPGSYWVKCHDWTNEHFVLEAGERRVVELTMRHSQRARGIVLDAAGRPVASAQILVSAGGTQPQWSFPVAISDANGRFALECLRTFALIGARHPLHGTSRYRVLMGEPRGGAAQHDITLHLPGEQAALRGRVIDDQGNPVAKAWVKIGEYTGRLEQDENGYRHQPPPAALRTTDADGRFEADGLRPGDRHLSVYRRGRSPHREVVTLRAGETGDVLVVLRHSAVLVGTVRDADGRPIAGATVEVDSWEYPENYEVKSDSKGSFRFEDLQLGSRGFQAAAKGYARQRRTLDLVGGAEQRWDIVLESRHRIRGRLVDHQGRRLAGWWVGLSKARRRIRTDAEGRFIAAEADTAANTLLVRAEPGFAPIVARFDDVVASETERTFVIGPEHAATARLRGRLVDDAGNPLVDAEVQLEQEGFPVVLDDRTIQTMADGTFEAGPLPPGRYEVTPAAGTMVFEPIDAEIAAQQTTDLGVLTGARPARLVVELTGDTTLRDRARVTLVAGDRRFHPRREGRLRTFGRAYPRDYRILVTVDGRECHDVELTLAPGSDLSRSFDVYQ